MKFTRYVVREDMDFSSENPPHQEWSVNPSWDPGTLIHLKKDSLVYVCSEENDRWFWVIDYPNRWVVSVDGKESFDHFFGFWGGGTIWPVEQEVLETFLKHVLNAKRVGGGEMDTDILGLGFGLGKEEDTPLIRCVARMALKIYSDPEADGIQGEGKFPDGIYAPSLMCDFEKEGGWSGVNPGREYWESRGDNRWDRQLRLLLADFGFSFSELMIEIEKMDKKEIGLFLGH